MISTKISICVPIYNVEKYIKRCAVSLMEQTYDNIEYVFVNDCTPDNSMVILQDTIAQYPSRINSVRIINLKENKGLSYVRNMIVKEATGDFILHVDSDDWAEHDMVETLVLEQQRRNADMVSCNILFHHHDGSVTIRDHYSNYGADPLSFITNKLNYYSIWGRLISRSLYSAHDIKCKEGCNIGEDFQTLPKLAYYAKNHVCVNRQLYHYDMSNPYSYTSKKKNSELHHQHIESLNIACNFFINIDKERFTSIIIPAKIEYLNRDLRKCVRNRDRKGFEIYKSEIAKIEKMYPQYKHRGLRHRLKKNYVIHCIVTNYLH